jgi:hypothetical protein
MTCGVRSAATSVHRPRHGRPRPGRNVAKTPDGFVSLGSLKPGSHTASPLELIRQIYFKTSKQTVENDFAHAIELLKSLPDEDARAKAHVYMEGLAEMRKEWVKAPGRAKGKGQRSKAGQRSKGKGEG